MDQAGPSADVLDIAESIDCHVEGADVHSTVRVVGTSPGAKPCQREGSPPPELDANCTIVFDRDCSMFNINGRQPSFECEPYDFEIRSGVCSRFSRRTGGEFVPVDEIRMDWILATTCRLCSHRRPSCEFSIRALADQLYSHTSRNYRCMPPVRPSLAVLRSGDRKPESITLRPTVRCHSCHAAADPRMVIFGCPALGCIRRDVHLCWCV